MRQLACRAWKGLTTCTRRFSSTKANSLTFSIHSATLAKALSESGSLYGWVEISVQSWDIEQSPQYWLKSPWCSSDTNLVVEGGWKIVGCDLILSSWIWTCAVVQSTCWKNGRAFNEPKSESLGINSGGMTACLAKMAEAIKIRKVASTSTMLRKDTSSVNKMESLITYASASELYYGFKFVDPRKREIVTTCNRPITFWQDVL